MPRQARADGRSAKAGRRIEPTADAPLIPVLAVIGVGLIGGSFAAALRQVGQVGEVLGVGRDAESLERAQALGLIDRVVCLSEAARRADLIFLATPVGAMPAILTELAPHLHPNVVITDGGSTKQDVVRAATEQLGSSASRFVPGHPIAGSEKNGPQAARSDLYLRCRVILTPLPDNPPDVVTRVQQAWQACGASVSQMPADQHDRLLASVSHLPHVVAFAYLTQIAREPDLALRLQHAGSGFRDFSRIAGASPEMWRDILLANCDAVRRELHAVQQVLHEIDQLLAKGDGDAIEALIAEASRIRRAWPA